MIDKDQWIDLPVGHNLEDHTNVSAYDNPSNYGANCIVDRHSHQAPQR